MKVPLFAAMPLVAALLWVVALAVEPGPLSPGSVLLVGVGLLAPATVGMVGITIAGGRWARRTVLATVAAMTVLALLRPIDFLWALALTLTVVAAVAVWTPTLTGAVRRLPAAAGPPARAVILPLLLIGLPYPLGLAAWDRATVSTVVVGIGAPVAALWYARIFPGGLLAVRVLWPVLAIGLAPFQWLAPAIFSVAAAIGIAVVAWHPTVKVAFHPPREAGTAYPIPPELVPEEVRDAAGIDEKGRPRR